MDVKEMRDHIIEEDTIKDPDVKEQASKIKHRQS